MRSTLNVVFIMAVCLSAVGAMLPDTGADVIKERPKKSVLHYVSAFEVVSLDSTHFMKQMTTYADPHSSSRVAPSGLSSGNAFWDSVETHPRLSSFSLSAFGLNFNVQLHKNEELFGPGYVQERRVYRDGKYFPAESTSRGLLPSEDCNYHGHVTESSQGSLVAVSTCRGGFEGLINAHGESFTILPAQHHMGRGEIQSHVQKLGLSSAKQGSLHILFKQSDYFEAPFGCGVTAAHEAARELRKESSEELNNVLYVVPKGRNEFGFGDQHHPRRHLLQSQKYVELVVFNDKLRFESLDDQTEITSNAQVNIQDGIYRATTSFQPNVQIVLIRQMTFINQDPWSTPIMGPTQSCPSCTAQEVDVDDLLAKFHSYRSVPANVGAHDNGHLFSGYDFQATVLGYAGVGTMCLQSQSGGINQATFANPNFNAAISTHEMGHNFDMRHDSTGNACPQSGFIMNAAVGQNPPTQFSTCSVTYYNAFIVSDDPTCLNNVPTEHWGDPVCGNGFVEAGEACDCGAPNCANTPNVCCNGATCNFTASAECSIGSPCCDNQCKIVRDTSRVCRASAGSCDFAEKCDGIGERCPNDEFVGAGTACTDATYGEGMCYAGVCMSHLRQCRDVGSRFQGAPFDNCPSDTQSRLNQGNFCGSMWCTNDPNSCTTFRLSTEIVSMANGVPCGGGQQCKDRQCVASQALNTAFSWSTGELSPCYDCSELQNRSVSCMRLNAVIRDPVFCTPSAKPPEKVQCTNETLGCVHTGPCDASSDVDFFSQCIPRNTILFGGLGAVSLFLVALACCYQAVTWGSEDEAAKKDDLGP